MNSQELAAWLATQEEVTEAEAEARLEALACGIRQLVQQGHEVELPGLGRFEPGVGLKFRFDGKAQARRDGGRQAAGKRR
ncbi:MAG: HU family DNA-binding protein [Acidobacteria bacterium]|nr:HU family DNA-binding protein [Acidobacteriota bacterium]